MRSSGRPLGSWERAGTDNHKHKTLALGHKAQIGAYWRADQVAHGALSAATLLPPTQAAQQGGGQDQRGRAGHRAGRRSA
jgi:hypothetical protein